MSRQNKKESEKIICGIIGSGFIGSAYANNFIKRGYEIIQYSLDEKFKKNKNKIKFCDIIFIAVPTPTTSKGFDYSIVEEVLKLVGKNKIAVIKSTILPGTTEKLQKKFPNIYIIHSPEFLTEMTAQEDANNPDRNIIGVTKKSKCKAGEVMNVLPTAPYEAIVDSKVAEFIKYGGNCWFYFKVLFINTLYDMTQAMEVDYEKVKDGMSADKRIGKTHLNPIHKTGRGAGGHCFIKDFAAYKRMYDEMFSDYNLGSEFLRVAEEYNKYLLKQSNKDLDILNSVYNKNL